MVIVVYLVSLAEDCMRLRYSFIIVLGFQAECCSEHARGIDEQHDPAHGA